MRHAANGRGPLPLGICGHKKRVLAPTYQNGDGRFVALAHEHGNNALDSDTLRDTFIIRAQPHHGLLASRIPGDSMKFNQISIYLAATLLCAGISSADAQTRPNADARLAARVAHVLQTTPLIDGHNDLPWEIRSHWGNADGVDLNSDTSNLRGKTDDGVGKISLMTDIPRLRKGHVGGQFWSVWIPPEVTGPAAVEVTLEQIDLVAEDNRVIAFPSKFGSEDPAVGAARAQIRHLLEQAIDELPPAFRTVYMMREVEECSVEETAAQLDIKPQTVKTRLFRARRQLRAALEGTLATTMSDAFPFMGKRCARLSDAVMALIENEELPHA